MKKLIVILSLLLVGMGLYASEVTGREVVDGNKVVDISGIFQLIEDELYLKADGVKYQIHLGPEEYSQSIGFSKEFLGVAIIKGYILNYNIAPMKITYNNKIYDFWDTNGKPMWRGQTYSGGNGNDIH